MSIVEISKKHYDELIGNQGQSLIHITNHIPQVKNWAERILSRYPQSNKEVVLASVWLHDIGRVVGDPMVDHAINSEIEARRFLSENSFEEKIINDIAHCIRAHRRRDVQPQTLEATILVVADSASHMTDIVYPQMINRDGINIAMNKLNKDYEDTALLPEIRTEIEPLYLAWKNILNIWPKY